MADKQQPPVPERIYIHPTSAEWHPNRWPQEPDEYIEYARVHPVDDARIEEIRELRDKAWRERREGKEVEPPSWEDVGHLLSRLPQLSSSERRCGECGHNEDLQRSDDGTCNELSESGNDQRCGCKCVFPATGPATPPQDQIVAHRCKNGTVKPYPTALCSMPCNEATNLTLRVLCGVAATGAGEGAQRDIWDMLNKRRHELIGIKHSNGLLEYRDEADYNALQRVAGIVRALLTPPLPVPVAEGEPLVRCVHCGATEHSYQQEWDHPFESLAPASARPLLENMKEVHRIVAEGGPEFQQEWSDALHAFRGDESTATPGDAARDQVNKLVGALISIEFADTACECSHESADCCAIVGEFCARCWAHVALLEVDGKNTVHEIAKRLLPYVTNHVEAAESAGIQAITLSEIERLIAG